MNNRTILLALAALLLGGLLALGLYRWSSLPNNNPDGPDVDVITRTEYHLPPPPPEDVLVDDKLEDKKPDFDPDLMDRRPLGEWLVNQSAAVIRLDIASIKPDREAGLLALHASYKDARAAGDSLGRTILPSVNLLDGKAKQFDDGLYAALDAAYYRGLDKKLHSHIQLVQRLYDKTGKDNVAAPFLAAGLELAGVSVEPADKKTKDKLLNDFRTNEIASKPIGFYTWNKTLEDCFRFLRFFQQEFDLQDSAVPLALAGALAADPALLADYQKALAFYARLTNPYICHSMADLVGMKEINASQLNKLRQEKNIAHATVSLFPPSTSRETVLFEKLFPNGLPANVNLMNELIRRIRSGEVDLKPKPDSGWYDYQVYALETLLLPEKGAETGKLLLTKAYKKRMLEAFQALVTKHRETHVRQLGIPMAASMAPPLKDVGPRLRVEPCPSYYLRTARAYAFLANFLEAAVGKEGLQSLHGLRQGGNRDKDLYGELHGMRDLFYGLYLVSAEDIGLKPALAAGEAADPERCYREATTWLSRAFEDPDLSADTRVVIPIFVNLPAQTTRIWATLGVRLAKLDAQYARPPHLKPLKEGKWKLADDYQLATSNYLIPVDEFAEVELPGLYVLTRAELRTLCDREKTREAILAALRKGR